MRRTLLVSSVVSALVLSLGCGSSNKTTSTSDVLLFNGTDGTHGWELWMTDGTPQGTRMHKDLNPEGDSSPYGFTPFQGEIYFGAQGTGGTWGLWKTDATAGGTVLVQEFANGPGNLTPFQGSLYFTATALSEDGYDSGLWVTRGTPESTQVVRNHVWSPLIVAGDRLYFRARDQDTGSTALWSMDGSGDAREIAPELWNIGEAVALGNTVFFSAQDFFKEESRLWMTDGTTRGTQLVGSLTPANVINPSSLTPVGDALYFMATDGTHGYELWKTDGQNTSMVKDIQDAAGTGSSPRPLTAVNGKLYFWATDLTGRHLWSSDGTAEGTTMVPAKPDGTELLDPNLSDASFAEFNGSLYFAAMDKAVSYGTELWKVDGSGTAVLVSDIRPGPLGSNPGGFQVLKDALYFAADDGVNGRELWKTDAPGATALVQDLNPNGGDSSPTGLSVSGGLLRFSMRNSKYAFADEAGNVEVIGSSSSLVQVNGRYIFACSTYDDIASKGTELCAASALSDKPLLLEDINPGPASSSIANLVPCGARACFTASDPTHGLELWSTDGTPEGTMLIDINPGAADSYPTLFAALNGKVYFSATDGTHGAALYSTDGTVAGTSALAVINPGANRFTPTLLATLGNRLIFAAYSGSTDCEPWSTDGTPGGTFRLADLNSGSSGSYPSYIGTVNGRVILFANGTYNGTNASRLWSTDGGTGVGLLKDIQAWTASATLNGLLYFMGWDSTNGTALWSSDGTSAGTNLVKAVAPPSVSARPTGFSLIGGRLFFFANDGASGTQLWTSDGTPAGTQMVVNLKPFALTASSTSGFVIPAGDKFYFVADDGAKGSELWVYSPPTGSRMVKDIFPGILGSNPSNLTPIGNMLYFAADDGIHGRELWSSDGTEQGTQLVKDTQAGPVGSNPASLAVVSGRLLFAADDGASGQELWVSDGTAEGTRMLADINPGPLGSKPADLLTLGSHLFFSALDPASGRELWVTDGSTVKMLTELWPEGADGFAGFWHPAAVGGDQIIWVD